MKRKLRVLDLFSGIGGFSLGLERTGGFETVAFCEVDSYCRKVLKKHWPKVPIRNDIRKQKFTRTRADVIVGGFPCQDISSAGGGAGLSGERSGLWRELLRAIRVVRPRYAIVENVAALLGRGMGTVLGNLAEVGYDAEWHCVPASAVGAEHIRDRVWIIAADANEVRKLQPQGRKQNKRRRPSYCPVSHASNSDTPRHARGLQAEPHRTHVGEFGERLRSSINAAGSPSREHWNHQPVLGRGFHGVSNRVDRIGALGNAVFPAIPEAIGQAVLETTGLSTTETEVAA